MTTDEQEARSLRFESRTASFRRLSSGRFAIYNLAWDLCGVVERLEDWETVWYKGSLPIANESYRTMKEEDADELLREAGL
jgi:hypothetical protein